MSTQNISTFTPGMPPPIPSGFQASTMSFLRQSTSGPVTSKTVSSQVTNPKSSSTLATTYSTKIEELMAILDYLNENARTRNIPTLEIAKAIYGRFGTVKMINGTLYSLKRMGAINVQFDINNKNPEWYVITEIEEKIRPVRNYRTTQTSAPIAPMITSMPSGPVPSTNRGVTIKINPSGSKVSLPSSATPNLPPLNSRLNPSSSSSSSILPPRITMKQLPPSPSTSRSSTPVSPSSLTLRGGSVLPPLMASSNIPSSNIPPPAGPKSPPPKLPS